MRFILPRLMVLALFGGAAAYGQSPSGHAAAPPSPTETPPPTVTPTPVTPPATADAPAADAAATDDLGPDPTAPQAGGHFPGDPFEKLNRKIWAADLAVDRVVLKPASSVYRHVTPKPLRHGLSRVLSNLGEPWSFVNNMLQGHPDRAARNLGRFLVNTTIGVGGLADHASAFGVRPANEDFGQTLAVWGVMKNSPYLVLPLLGPSTIRDGIGQIVAGYADPYHICLKYCVDTSWWTRAGITAFTAVSARADATEAGADTFLASSLDSYAAARSAYLQQRASAIANEDDEGGAAAGADSTPGSDTGTPADAAAPATPGGASPSEPPPAADDRALDQSDQATTPAEPPSAPSPGPSPNGR